MAFAFLPFFGSDLEAFHLFEMYSDLKYVTEMYLDWQVLLVHLF